MVSLAAIVQPLPLTRLAYERLRESILSGQMAPGEIYNEMALAKEMGVSRTPVREALLELSSQGLVTFLPRKGVQVNYFTERRCRRGLRDPQRHRVGYRGEGGPQPRCVQLQQSGEGAGRERQGRREAGCTDVPARGPCRAPRTGGSVRQPPHDDHHQQPAGHHPPDERRGSDQAPPLGRGPRGTHAGGRSHACRRRGQGDRAPCATTWR